MSIFYNPQTRKAKPLIILIALLTPIIVCVLIYSITKNIAEKLDKNKKVQDTASDIFVTP